MASQIMIFFHNGKRSGFSGIVTAKFQTKRQNTLDLLYLIRNPRLLTLPANI